MITNKPKVQYYNPITYGVQIAWMQEDAFGGWVRAVNYEVLQAECEELRTALDAHKAARIAYASEFPLGADGTPDVGNIHENIRLLKKDAEFGRSVLAKREPGKVYGCHCDLEEGMEPDGCVIDDNKRYSCTYAEDHITVKEECEYWQVIATDRENNRDNQ